MLIAAELQNSYYLISSTLLFLEFLYIFVFKGLFQPKINE